MIYPEHSYIPAGAQVSARSLIRSGSSIGGGAHISKNSVIESHVRVGANCIVGDSCIIGARCQIGPGCVFGQGCTFWELPMCLHWNLGYLPDDITNELMHRDADAHPYPEEFEKWAKGGRCPYSSYPVQRLHKFRQRSSAWKSEWNRVRDYDLIRAICAYKEWDIPHFKMETL